MKHSKNARKKLGFPTESATFCKVQNHQRRESPNMHASSKLMYLREIVSKELY